MMLYLYQKIFNQHFLVLMANGIMNWGQLLSDRRLGDDSPRIGSQTTKARSDFERDYDRMVFSAPFRRLQNKTQVFPLPGNIFVHNRLTHSLEVSCLGRSLGNIVGRTLMQRHGSDIQPFDSDISSIVSAACLAHDMGNPPFGHSGERAISAYFTEGDGQIWKQRVEAEGDRWQDFVHFEGNANALRLLTHRFLGRKPGGYALTYSTLASIVKYPHSSLGAGAHGGKFGFFATEEETMRLIAEELGLIQLSHADEPLRYARYPLVYLVEAADDICYQIMDLEDAYKLHLLPLDLVKALILDFFPSEQHNAIMARQNTISDQNEQVAYLRSKVINLLVEETASVFLEHEENILRGSFSSSLIAHASPRTLEAYQACTRIAYEQIYRCREVVDVELAGHRIFRALIGHLMEAMCHPEHTYSKALLNRVSSQYDTRRPTTYGKIQCTLDFISGMTDIYALDLYRRITGMNLPAI